MTVNTLFFIIMLVSALGFVMFTVSAIVNIFKRRASFVDWKKVLFFLALTVVAFFMFGMTVDVSGY